MFDMNAELSAIEVCDQFIVVVFRGGRVRVLPNYRAPERFCRSLLRSGFIHHSSVLHHSRKLESGPRYLASHLVFVFCRIDVQRQL